MSKLARVLGRLVPGGLSERDRRALRLGLTIAVPVLLWLFGVRPYLAAHQDLQDQIAAERALLARETALIRHADALPAAVRDAQQEAERVDQRLVHATDVALVEAEVTDVLQALASSSRVLLEEMRGLQPDRRSSDSGVVQPVRLAVQGESDLDGVTRFLHGVEENPLLLRVAELSIEPVTASPQTGGRGRSNEPAPPQQTGVVRFAMIVVAYAPPDLPGARSPESTEQVP